MDNPVWITGVVKGRGDHGAEPELVIDLPDQQDPCVAGEVRWKGRSADRGKSSRLGPVCQFLPSPGFGLASRSGVASARKASSLASPPRLAALGPELTDRP